MEIWKPVQGYEGYYEVSSHGRVRSVERVVASSRRNGGSRRRPSKILRQNTKRNGYKTVDLSRDGKVKTSLVHRIVASAFCPIPTTDCNVVNHLNLNKADNRPENLEWCTSAKNSMHASENGAILSAERHPNSKSIRCVETGKEFPSSYQAAEWVNVNKYHSTHDTAGMSRHIRGCVTGYQRTAYGYHWQDVVSKSSTTIPCGSTSKRMEMGCSSVSEEEDIV